MLKDWKLWFGLAISAGAIVWVFKGQDFDAIVRAMKRTNWFVLVLSVIPLFTSIILRSWRWKFFIPNDTSSLHTKYDAVNIGFFATTVLPARLGEFARGLVFAQKASRSRLEILTTIAVERLFDIFALLVLFVICLPFIPIDALQGSKEDLGVLSLSREKLMTISAALTVGGLLGFLALCAWGRAIATFLTRRVGLRHPTFDKWMHSIFDGLEALWHGKKIFPALIGSLVLWFNCAFSFWIALLAFPTGETTLGAVLGIEGAIFLNTVLCAGVALPSSPGFIGVWQAATVFAFKPYSGVDPNSVLSFAILVHLMTSIMSILLGFQSFHHSGISFSEVKRVKDSGDTPTDSKS